MEAMEIINPQNIKIVGISAYIKNPNIKAANGSDPESKMEDTPESICFKLKVENIYGRANENVECRIKNSIVNAGLIETKFVIWSKLVNGISAMEIKMME